MDGETKKKAVGKARTPKQRETIKRRVEFFRVIRSTRHDGEPIPHRIDEQLAKISSFSFDDDDRYERESDGVYRFVSQVGTGWPIHLMFCRSRRKGRPLIEARGEMTPVVMPDGSGICEVTNLVIFEDGLVGAEFNYFGPRTIGLSKHIAKIVSKDIPVTWRLEYLLDPQALRNLENMTNVANVQFEITRESAEDLGDTDLEGHLKRLAQGTKVQTFKLEMGVDPKDKTAGQRLKSMVRSLVDSKKSEKFTSMKMRAKPTDLSSMEVIDLFADRISKRMDFRLDENNQKVVDSPAAFEVIKQAKRDLLTRIKRGVTMAMKVDSLVGQIGHDSEGEDDDGERDAEDQD